MFRSLALIILLFFCLSWSLIITIPMSNSAALVEKEILELSRFCSAFLKVVPLRKEQCLEEGGNCRCINDIVVRLKDEDVPNSDVSIKMRRTVDKNLSIITTLISELSSINEKLITLDEIIKLPKEQL